MWKQHSFSCLFPRIFYESVLWGVGLGPGSGVKSWIFDLQPPTLCPCSKMTHIVCLNMIMLLEYILDSPLGKQFQPSYEPPAEMITRHVCHWHGGHRHWPLLRWRYLRLHRSSRFQLVQGASLWLPAYGCNDAWRHWEVEVIPAQERQGWGTGTTFQISGYIIWVRYNNLTATSLEQCLVGITIPKIAELFRFGESCNLSRNISEDHRRWV